MVLSKKGHESGKRFLATGCSRPPSNAWPLQESDAFGFCAREKVRRHRTTVLGDYLILIHFVAMGTPVSTYLCDEPSDLIFFF